MSPNNSTNPPQQNYYLDPVAPKKSEVILKKTAKFSFGIVQILVGLAILGVILYLFVFPISVVDGPSMQPNFCTKDVYITFKLGGLINPLGFHRGQVVAFKENNNTNLIKRIIGMPGDTLMVRDGKVYINGEIINEVYLPEGRLTDPFNKYLFDGEEYVVPNNTYFVMGDNRYNSIDSRDIGPINPLSINGNVIAVIWPLNRFRLFNETQVFPENTCD